MLKTTIAGSLPKPEWLAEPKKLWPAWRGAGVELEHAKRDATLLWLAAVGGKLARRRRIA